jgi:hypothetical protein
LNRGSTKKQRLEGQQHYDELESDIDRRVSERFHRKPYQSYTVDDYLKKMGVDITKGVDSIGTDDQGKTDGIQKQ